jgi:hypothetical protein
MGELGGSDHGRLSLRYKVFSVYLYKSEILQSLLDLRLYRI